ncbi:MAG TPA: glycosyltransferase family 9 protein [Balneolaceae bacterium]|nr:glycosyltransferase family 9 protein [Balneolaceae bacterium]
MGKLFKERGNNFLRFLDRYVGIPLVFFLSFFRKKRSLPQKEPIAQRPIFIKMSGIGDSILTLPIIRELKETNPDINITVICGKNNREVFKNLLVNNAIDKLIYIDVGRLVFNWVYLWQKIYELGTGRYDYCIDFDPWSRISALLSFWVSADFKIGFRKENQFKHYLFDQRETHEQTIHECDNYKKLVKPIVGNIGHVPQYPVFYDSEVYQRKFITSRGIQRYIIFHPWAAGYRHTLKELDTSSVLYICKKLTARGYEIIITGGKKDIEKSKSLTERIDHAYSIAGQTNLNETAIFLKNAACVITVNTGVLHLAAAVNSKIVSVNGPTDVNRWRPLCDKAINIKSNLFCSPCLDLGFEYKCEQHGVPEGHCMKKIDLDEVVESALKLVSSG